MDNEKIGINREKSVKVWNSFKRLEEDFETLSYMLRSLSSVIQNPDFSCKEDINLFQASCERFEKKYHANKMMVVELFGEEFGK